MPKKLSGYENYHIKVTAETYWLRERTHSEQMQKLREIEKDIKRHVDGIADTDVLYEPIYGCEFCKSEWTEDGDYNGGCCEEDEKANELRKITS